MMVLFRVEKKAEKMENSRDFMILNQYHISFDINAIQRIPLLYIIGKTVTTTPSYYIICIAVFSPL